ncbi:MAG: bifunctional methionine sulfoxide reductase B/A protein [Phycisphaerales bacterium]|nr:bifunctional methionine sulfoxide reductase B/A protein [Phycisphaerales bacterium]
MSNVARLAILGLIGASLGLGVAFVLLRPSDASARLVALTTQQPENTGKDQMRHTTAEGAVAGHAEVHSISRSAFDVTPLGPERVQQLAAKLTEDEARVILKKGTEPAFCGTLVDNHKQGTYVCRLCHLPLFSSGTKFDSGTGWPSFFAPYDPQHVSYERDSGLGMERVEILCARCHGHLGHVFDDAPGTPTGLRYCLNSASLEFVEDGTALPGDAGQIATQKAYFAGGCFWGTEDRFQQVPGVVNVVSGYQGGRAQEPTYKQVCYEDTGHAESVEVTFDPSVVSYAQLLDYFFKFHNPTTLNRQGPDVGEQYRSAIFAVDQAQYDAAKACIAELSKLEKFQKKPIVTKVEMFAPFYPAEAYHQDYHERNGGHCPIDVE